MSLTITDDHISGDYTRHTARAVTGRPHAWEVSWLPGRLLDRNTAITAMVLAEVAGASTPQAGDRLWPHIESWAAEIGLTAADVLARVSQPSGSVTTEKGGAVQSDPEVGS
jgi:hypothetical protein